MPRNPENPRVRPENIDPEEVVRLRREGLTVLQVAVVLKVSKKFLDTHFPAELKRGEELRAENVHEQAKALAGMGLNYEEIAEVVGVHRDTLRERYGPELIAAGKARLSGSLKRKIYERGVHDGRDVMLIWASKNHMGWSDNVNMNHSGTIGIDEVRDAVVNRQSEVRKRVAEDTALTGVVEHSSGEDGTNTISE
jgi:hypothetical protein